MRMRAIDRHFEIYAQDEAEEEVEGEEEIEEEEEEDELDEYEWVAMPGACDVCYEMHGERRFSGGEYEGGLVPGSVHPHCKCFEVKV